MKKRIWFSLIFLLAMLCTAEGAVCTMPGAADVQAASKTSTTKTATKKYVNQFRYIGGKLYYYDKNGVRVKNRWVTSRRTGRRYYFKSNGAAATGVQKINGKRYLFYINGILKSEGIQTSGKYSYCLDSHGRILTGWQTVNGKKYYFDPDTGHMLKDTWIDGKKYVNANGVYKPNKKRQLAGLESKIRSAIRSYGGTWSVYVKNLDTNESFSINNQRIYAASLIKLYAMGAAYERIRQGRFSESSVSGLLNDMITVSDNSAFNSIVSKVGTKYINSWCKSNGYTGTNQGHGLSPSYNNYGLDNGSGSNVTTVVDCGKILENIYRGTCVSKNASSKMLKLLKRQERRSKIPAGVPSGVTVANKTGETDDTTHDAAIVYSKGADYILVVMASTPGSGWFSARYITSISSMVYNYLN